MTAAAGAAIWGVWSSMPAGNVAEYHRYETQTEARSENVRRQQIKNEADLHDEGLRKDKETPAEHRPPPARDVARKLVRRPW